MHMMCVCVCMSLCMFVPVCHYHQIAVNPADWKLITQWLDSTIWHMQEMHTRLVNILTQKTLLTPAMNRTNINHIVIVKLSHQTRITQISQISTQVTSQFCDFKSIEKWWNALKRMVPFVLCLAWRRHFLIHGTHHVIALFHHHSWAEQLSLHKLPAHVTAVTAPLSNIKAICDLHSTHVS